MTAETKPSPLSGLLKLGLRLDDAQDVRLQKSLLVAGSLMFIAAGAAWGVAYILLGAPAQGVIPLSYAIISSLSVVHFGITGRYQFFRYSQLVLILLLPCLLMLALGGFINASVVILWAFISPIGALLFAEYRQSPRWLLAYLGLLLASGVLQPFLRLPPPLSEAAINVFFVLNISAVTAIVFVLLHYFVGQKERAYGLLHAEQERSEHLLLNVLPHAIAARLKRGETVIADHHPSVSILFADLVGFTPLASELSPIEIVTLLNRIYSHFDTLVEQCGLEKIRTMGDSYMVAAGLPRPRPDHAQALARLALDMTAYIAALPPVDRLDCRPDCPPLAFRIGISSGPVIAGVIGHKKFTYDVWGDTVNTASRMESQGRPGKIQISQPTYELLKNEFVCDPQGPVVVKGKGEMQTWLLTGPCS